MARRFRALIAADNRDTGDGRRFPEGSFTWRTPPLSVMAQTSTPEFGGHAGAFVLGNMAAVTRMGEEVWAEGTLNDEGEGEDADRRRDVIAMIERGDLNGVSVDPAGVEVHFECLEFDDEEGWCVSEVMVFDSYVIGAATVVNVPAIEGTLIQLLDGDEDTPEDTPEGDNDTEEEPAEEADAVAASAAATLEHPPADWFEHPGDLLAPADDPDGRLPVVTPEGRVYGRLASWDDCHISFPNYCQTPWRSQAGYAYHRINPIDAVDADGQTVRVRAGALAVQGGHYPTTGEHARNWQAAQAHYDDPTTCAAYVVTGEDDDGIWFAGALRQGATAEQVALLRRHQLSGDWRRIGGSMELVGMCSVVVPGFVRSVAMAASGAPGTSGNQLEPVAAVIGGRATAEACCDDCDAGQPCAASASGSPRSLTAAAIDQRLARLEAEHAVISEVLGPQVRETLRARIRT